MKEYIFEKSIWTVLNIDYRILVIALLHETSLTFTKCVPVDVTGSIYFVRCLLHILSEFSVYKLTEQYFVRWRASLTHLSLFPCIVLNY